MLWGKTEAGKEGEGFCEKVMFRRNLKEVREKAMQVFAGRPFLAEEKPRTHALNLELVSGIFSAEGGG